MLHGATATTTTTKRIEVEGKLIWERKDKSGQEARKSVVGEGEYDQNSL